MAVDSMDYAYLIFLSIVIAMITVGSLITFRVIFKNKIDDADRKLDTKNRSKTVVILYLVLFFSCIFLLTTSSISKRTTSSFNQHLRIITPYITTQEKDLIISEFASMKSQKDYRILYDKINSIAVKNDLELPKNKLYIF
jgi:formate hydrogenlyase subunit 3/multisubunit Na+/H+ antiporter MnhD subunit